MAITISDDDVRYVAKLSRLKLREDEVHPIAQQLSHVLGYIEKLSELNVEGVEPMAHPTAITNRLREDEPTEPLTVGEALANAPRAEPPFFEVPKVLGEGSGA